MSMNSFRKIIHIVSDIIATTIVAVGIFSITGAIAVLVAIKFKTNLILTVMFFFLMVAILSISMALYLRADQTGTFPTPPIQAVRDYMIAGVKYLKGIKHIWRVAAAMLLTIAKSVRKILVPAIAVICIALLIYGASIIKAKLEKPSAPESKSPAHEGPGGRPKEKTKGKSGKKTPEKKPPK